MQSARAQGRGDHGWARGAAPIGAAPDQVLAILLAACMCKKLLTRMDADDAKRTPQHERLLMAIAGVLETWQAAGSETRGDAWNKLTQQ